MNQGKPDNKGCLILGRKQGSCFYLGDDIKITVALIKGKQVRLKIEAPKDLKIEREK